MKSIFLDRSSDKEVLYIPLFYFSFLLEHILHGSIEVLYLTNILIHLLNITLLFVLLKHFKLSSMLILFILLIFAIHPIQVESVTWLMGRKDLLACLFILIAGLSYFKLSESQFNVIYLVPFMLACLAKPIVLMIPLCIIVYEYLYRKRINWGINSFLILIVVVVYNLNHSFIAQKKEDRFELVNLTFGAWHWVKRFLLVEPVEPLYFWPIEEHLFSFVGLLFIFITLGALVFHYKKKQNLSFILLLSFLLNSLPSTYILLKHNRFFFSADRYSYFPLIFLLIYLILLMKKLVNQHKVIIIACVLAVIMSYKSHKALSIWSSDITFWTHCIQKYPNEGRVNRLYAIALRNQGNFEEATPYFSIAYELENYYPKVGILYAENLIETGDSIKAIEVLKEVRENVNFLMKADQVAIKHLKEEFNRSSSVGHLLNLAEYYVFMNQPLRAKVLLEPYLTKDDYKESVVPFYDLILEVFPETR
ncbi:MAG: hypothetical protein MK193_01705 [Lentisphaeria bacterium]|nr:hypothetical protein [Lentisphaeria bacterium]